ncbi:MAG: CHAT domain-containing protein [Vicinamibacteraceae bacterium]
MRHGPARRWLAPQLFGAALLVVWQACTPPAEDSFGGLVVEAAAAGYGAARAGLQPGDVLIAWRASGGPPSEPQVRWRSLSTPSDADEAALRAGQTGIVLLDIRRAGRSLKASLPPAPWKLDTRPRFSPSGEHRFLNGKRAIAGGDVARGTRIWEALARQERAARPAAACWLSVAMARVLAERQRAEALDRWMGAAMRCADELRDPELLAWTWLQIGGMREEATQMEAAIDAYTQGIDETDVPPVWLDHLRLRLGDARFRASDHAGAGEAYRRVRDGWTRRGARGADYIAATIGLGKVERNQSRFDRAGAYLDEARLVAEQLDSDHPLAAFALQEAGMLAYWQSDLSLAEQRYQEAGSRFRRVGIDDSNLATLHMGLGAVALERGELAAAEGSFEDARAIFERDSPGSLLVAWSLRGLGQVAHVRGELSLARRRYRQALRLIDALGLHAADRAFVLREIGAVAYDAGELERARDAMMQALEILETHYPASKFPPRVQTSLGAVLLELGERDRARRHLASALAAWERLLPGSLDHAETHYQMGEWAHHAGDLASARVHHEAALAIRSRLAPHSSLGAMSHQALGRIAVSASSRREALAHFQRALRAVEAQVGSLGISDLSRARFRAGHSAVYKETIDLLLELGDERGAFDLLERYRANQGRELFGHRPLRLERAARPELAERRNRLVREYEATWRALFQADAAPEHRREVERLRDRLAELEQERQVVHTRQRELDPALAESVDPPAARLSDVVERLSPDVAIMSYSVTPNETRLFVVRDGKLEVVRLGVGGNELARMVERLRLLLASVGPENAGRRALHRQGRELYGLLIAPAERIIDSADRLIILADGPLHLLPFAVLVRGGTRETGMELLVQWKPFHMQASLGDLARSGPARSQSSGNERAHGDLHALLVFADVIPQSGGAAATGLGRRGLETGQGGALEPLPYTRLEAAALQELFGSSAEIRLGADATEASAKRDAPRFRYVHFATHALLDSASPLDSSLVLFPSPSSSGRREDGLLRGWEVVEELELGADVVSLSACESALGEELAGAGVVGLTRAFRLAGARSVVASLWQVQDRSTAMLMARFYAGLRDGLPTGEALRQAQLALLRHRSFSHPHHWAAFQLYGDWR